MKNLVRRSEVVLRGDPQRVISRIFIPGEEELIRGASRVNDVLDRCLSLSAAQVHEELVETVANFSHRHRDLEGQFELHYSAVQHLIADEDRLDVERKRLIGAYLTQEYAVEAAAYFNPSIVAHPDQTGLEPDHLRFVMSVRAVGEGHISTLAFRSGIIDPEGGIEVEPASKFATTRAHRYTVLRNELVQQSAKDAGIYTADLQFLLGMLPDKFSPEELNSRLNLLKMHPDGLEHPYEFMETLQEIARNSYEVDFDEGTLLSERVLWPIASDERRGIEDARFVQVADAVGKISYRATYTGFDGTHVVSRMLETNDFRTFSSLKLSGKAVQNKGVAFFPRPVDGRYCALSRWDRESNSIAYSDDGYHWDEIKNFQAPKQTWELIQIGNCGSPIETDDGWLVITHGVGAMREYSISAVLLDLDKPEIMIGALSTPLLTPNPDERNGYVPNVVYSCGSLVHRGKLIMPYGFSDYRTSFATMELSEVLAEMKPM
ncbi:MAG: glycoside hydrolase family 130 protein [Actinomycetota bacterium]|nr:glycoside hydrolase family 130 protein [Actinomycetota bacterium]